MKKSCLRASIAVPTAVIISFTGFPGAVATEPPARSEPVGPVALTVPVDASALESPTGPSATVAQIGTSDSSPGSVAGTASTLVYTEATAEQVRIVFDAHNAHRRSQGLKPLLYSPQLSRVAQDWSNTMATTRDFKHNPRYSAQMPDGWRWAAENIGANTRTGAEGATQLTPQWIESTGHEANMTDPRGTHIGIGIANTEPIFGPDGDVLRWGTYATVVFGGYNDPLPGSSPTSPSAVTPEFVIFADPLGTAQDTYIIPSRVGVEYLVNGAVKAAGTYPGTGTVTVTARALPGYLMAEGATTSWTKTFTGAPGTIAVSPVAPSFTDRDGAGNDTYTIPSRTGVDYLVNGIVKPAGTYRGTGTITVTARARTGYALTPGSTSSWQKTFNTAVVGDYLGGKSPFVDITPETTFYTEMVWMAANGISGGWATDDGKEYRPHVAVDRDVMAAFLYRLAGEPAYTPPAVSPFVDITPQTTFYKEMAWMADNDISGGWATPAGKEYRPHTAVDRDVMAAFLYRLKPLL